MGTLGFVVIKAEACYAERGGYRSMSGDVLVSTFESVALLLGIGALGLWVIGRRILPKEALGVLSIFALDIALPSLVFVNILQNFKPSESQDWWLLPLWWSVSQSF